MSARSKELLLEVLLLSVRYSAAEVAWVKKELSNYPAGSEFRDLLRSFRSGDQPRVRPAQTKQDTRTDISRVAPSDAFPNPRSDRERRRLENVAKRLGLKLRGKTTDELAESVRGKLKELPPQEAELAIRGRGEGSRPDDGYIGLANFLIGSPTEK